MFRCPNCHAALSELDRELKVNCSNCGAVVPVIDGIPFLVKDRQKLEETLLEAKSSSRRDWYEAPQATQLVGPYRHHLQKRRDYVIGALRAYRDSLGRPPIGLDLGCGDGNNLPWLLPNFGQLHASDYNITRLRRAQRTPGVSKVFMADIRDYPVVDDTFDVIYFNHVLEHIPEDHEALVEILRILRPGGLLVLGVPNEGAWFWQLAYRLQPDSLRTTDHVQFYIAKTLAARCEGAGFTVQEVKPIGWGVPHWTLDTWIRGYKWIDDLFAFLGSRLLPSQATSLYMLLRKPAV